MITINSISSFLDRAAPTRLAEDWDNVGLLVGDPQLSASTVMTCLTITPDSAAEAIERNADLIVAHHPLPFRPIKKITTGQTPTRLLWQLINHGISIYSPHTGFDSAAGGINQMVCERIGLSEIKPLTPFADDPQQLGSGRFGGCQPIACADFLQQLKQVYGLEGLRFVGDANSKVSTVGSACGSGGSFLGAASKAGCDTLITGEADFHSCLEASALNMNLILLGHYASERFAIEALAEQIATEFPELTVWPAEQEVDPIQWC